MQANDPDTVNKPEISADEVSEFLRKLLISLKKMRVNSPKFSYLARMAVALFPWQNDSNLHNAIRFVYWKSSWQT